MNQTPDEYCLPGLLGEEELKLAVQALRLAPGTERLTVDQLRAWKLVRDTYLGDWLSHPGSATEQTVGDDDRPVVITKRQISMAKFRH